MKINIALTKDKKGLQVVVVLPERKLASEEIITRSAREIVSIVEKDYPEYTFCTGPRKISNDNSENLVGTWAFVMTDIPTPTREKKVSTTRPAPSHEKKASPPHSQPKKPPAKKSSPRKKKILNNED